MILAFRTIAFLKNYTRKCTNLRNIVRSTNAQFYRTPEFLHGEYEFQDPKTDDEIVNVIYVDRNGKKIPIRDFHKPKRKRMIYWI
ncbi:PREDICTED: uncharacterized protein LOC105359309 isoform X2 [Ceratosolen solmsi marchali]|uniref:Uncharacterized protein LOC105359309 isoform X2 n=1 Tax=Ceratosolen solmsi marchali TaxID=326594 RepID=A0AAJ6YBJ1_9HYME|nr:PREDICTED: uncharacterized protein LOC105359309 isoform X2 [Ceratosolen solmsi marchali]XP_011494173.1 PREDICTED: uncharacterized protein LOC105359309 isoform X2 [Ceratosolen solmsi marchali]